MKQDAKAESRRRRRKRHKYTEDKPVEKKKPAKKKLQRPKEIKAGCLREYVKAGALTPREVLDWLAEQPGPHSPKFESWLRRKVKE